MSRFLFATWEGGGHVQPMLLAARDLANQGHQVLALSDACNAADAAALAVPFQAWRTAPSRRDRSPETDPLQDWRAKSPLEVIEQLLGGVMCGPAGRYGADVRDAAAAFGADVVVSQELLFGVMAAAEATRRPLAIFAANVWPFPTLADAPPFGGGLPPPRTDFDREFYGRVTAATRAAYQRGLPALNEARSALGLAPLDDLFDQLKAARRILLATSSAFDFDQRPPEPYAYVGPYLADPAWVDDWSPPWPADDARPLVLASFSTMYQGQEALLRRVIEALASLPVRALVTLGPVLSARDFSAPSNVCIAASAPHGRLLPQVSAVITHAGHASALRPLMAGVPLVCVPLGRDQADNAERVVSRGAGLRLASDVTASAIAEAVQAVLGQPDFAESARALGARIAEDAAGRSADRSLIALAKEATLA